MKDLINKILTGLALIGGAALWFFKNKSERLERENKKLNTGREILESDEPIDKQTEELLGEIDKSADVVNMFNKSFGVRSKKRVRGNTKPRRPK